MDDVQGQSLTEIRVMVGAVEVEDFAKNFATALGLDGSKPYVIRKPTIGLVEAMSSLPFVTATGTFCGQYANSQQAKTKGRVQCPLKPAALSSDIRGHMLKHAGFNDIDDLLTPEQREEKRMYYSVSLFAMVGKFAGSNAFCHTEYEGGGQLRYLISGERLVVCSRVDTLVAALAMVGTPVKSLAELVAVFKKLSIPDIDKLNGCGAVFYMFKHAGQSVAYTPPGFVMAERVLNAKDVVGVRTVAMSTKATH